MTEPDNPALPHLPPTYPMAFLFVAAVLEFILPLAFLAQPALASWQTAGGLLLAAAGLGFGVWGYSTMKAAGTPVEPFKPSLKIVEHGPYRLSRNPMYAGFLLIYAGLALIFALEWALIALPLLWLTLDRVVVRREEAYLTRKFGAVYTAYLGRTRRWI